MVHYSFITSSKNDLAFGIYADRAHGVASLKNGEMEIMVSLEKISSPNPSNPQK